MLNKITLAAIAAMVFVFTRTNAQTHDVSLNLAPMAFSNFSGNYSYNINENMSVGTVIGYQNLKVGSGSAEVAFEGFYAAPEFRFYFDPSRNGNDGFFAGGYTKFRSMGTSGGANIIENDDGTKITYDEKNTGLSLGVLTGKVWCAKSGFTFSAWMGFGYYLFDKTTYTNNFTPDPDMSIETNLPKLDIRLGLSVGYRFGL